MFSKLITKFQLLIDIIYTSLIQSSFKSFGNNSIISFHCILDNPGNIIIGNNVTIKKNVWLNAGIISKEKNQHSLIISDGCYISSYCQINAYKNVVIEKNVLIGEGVYFGDTIHSTKAYDKPILKQEYIFKGPVTIGEGSHLCRYSTISSNCKIGKNCITSPNSFVVHEEMPNYSMAIGNPAEIIENYNKKDE